MNTRQRLIQINRRNLSGGRSDLIEQADEIVEIPVTNYTDPVRWQLEVERVFHRLPLVAGFSCELRDVGSYKSIEMAGMPVLLCRDRSNKIGAFVNLCSHRGAVVVAEGGGKANSFSCPYHAWTYNLSGDLVSVRDSRDFGEIEKDCRGLVALPVCERVGIIWVVLQPNLQVDFDRFLQRYDEVLGYQGLENYHLVGSKRIEGPNWKICYDGYLDIYHLPILHRNTFGPEMPNRANYDAWGPHQTVTGPSLEYEHLAEVSDEDWPEENIAPGIKTIFPHVSIAGGLISQLFPGTEVGSSYTIQNLLISEEPTQERIEQAEEQFEFLNYVVREEDYRTCENIQRGLGKGPAHVIFGRNEGGLQTFHRWVDDLITTEDEDLAGLFPPI